jgi:hypothetical protein
LNRIGRAITSISHKYPSSKVFEIQLQKQIYLSPDLHTKGLFSYALSSRKNKTLHRFFSSLKFLKYHYKKTKSIVPLGGGHIKNPKNHTKMCKIFEIFLNK